MGVLLSSLEKSEIRTLGYKTGYNFLLEIQKLSRDLWGEMSDLEGIGDSDWPFTGPDLWSVCVSDRNPPDWIGRVVEAVLPHVLSGVDIGELDDDREVTPENAGLALGALFRLMGDYSAILARDDTRAKRFVDLTERLAAGASSGDGGLLVENVDRLRALVGRSLDDVAQNRSDVAPQFFERFARQASEPIIDSTNCKLWRQTDATPIHLLLLVFGEVAQRKLHTLPEFYRFLDHTQKGVYLGSYDRFRRICNRVGFGIGEKGSRGRQDINEIVASVVEGFIEAKDRFDENIRKSNPTHA